MGLSDNGNHKQRNKTMTIQRAKEILNIGSNDAKQSAALATSRLKTLAADIPLRYLVACDVLIEAGSK